MKHTLLKGGMACLMLFTFSQAAKSQWTTSGTSIYNTNTGNVGIGTASPSQKFHLSGGSFMMDYVSGMNGNFYMGGRTDIGQNGLRMWCMPIGIVSMDVRSTNATDGLVFRVDQSIGGTERMRISANGNVGIGTIAPTSRLTVVGDFRLVDNSSVDYAYGVRLHAGRDLTKIFTVFDKNSNEVFRIHGNGVVNAKKIYAEEFEVHPNAMGIAWYDHVFAPEYSLKGLGELEQYIKKHSHLPGIPSQQDVNEKGFNLAEMDGLLLQKVEELTLYVIQQQKEIEALKAALATKETANK